MASAELAALDSTVPKKDVVVTVLRASGLAKADFSFTGKGASDPFCEVEWNSKKIHKTKVGPLHDHATALARFCADTGSRNDAMDSPRWW